MQNKILESEVEKLLVENPVLLEEGLRFREKRARLKEAGIIDLIFEDSDGKSVFIEVKRGPAGRTNIGQVTGYFGVLKREQPEARIMFIAEEIKPAFKIALGLLGIKYKEFVQLDEELTVIKRLKQKEEALNAALKDLEWARTRIGEMIDKGYVKGYAGLKTGAAPVSALREYDHQLGWRLNDLQKRVKAMKT